jgi:hypothetical protein
MISPNRPPFIGWLLRGSAMGFTCPSAAKLIPAARTGIRIWFCGGFRLFRIDPFQRVDAAVVGQFDCLHDCHPSRHLYLRGANARSELATKEVTDSDSEVGRVGFKRKMTSVVEVDLGVGIITLERLGTRWQEKRVVFAPNGQ